jgi:hypothetical protein
MALLRDLQYQVRSSGVFGVPMSHGTRDGSGFLLSEPGSLYCFSESPISPFPLRFSFPPPVVYNLGPNIRDPVSRHGLAADHPLPLRLCYSAAPTSAKLLAIRASCPTARPSQPTDLGPRAAPGRGHPTRFARRRDGLVGLSGCHCCGRRGDRLFLKVRFELRPMGAKPRRSLRAWLGFVNRTRSYLSCLRDRTDGRDWGKEWEGYGTVLQFLDSQLQS